MPIDEQRLHLCPNGERENMDYKDPTSEQIEKLKDMSHEEIRKLAADEGLPLSDEDLDQVAGGWESTKKGEPCPKGGKHNWKEVGDMDHGTMILYIHECTKCGATMRSRE